MIGGYVTADPISRNSAAEIKEMLDLNVGQLRGKYLGPIEVAEGYTTYGNLRIPFSKWDDLNIGDYASIGYARPAGFSASPTSMFASEYILKKPVRPTAITFKHYKK